MSARSSQKRARSAAAADNENYVCMEFMSECVKVSFPSPEPAAAQRALAAERRCKSHLISHQVPDLDVEFVGSCYAPTAVVTVKKRLLDKLPLLAEVQDSTQRGVAATHDVECCVWSFLSVLILLSGQIGPADWFWDAHEASDPDLPLNTMKVADYLRCDGVQTQIKAWLVQENQNTIEALDDFKKFQSMRHKYITKVLCTLPLDMFKEVTERSFGCPFHYLLLTEKWVDAHAPIIDFRINCLNQGDWCMLTSALSKTQKEVKELYLPAVYGDFLPSAATDFILRSAMVMLSGSKTLTTLSLQQLTMDKRAVRGFDMLVQNLPATVTEMHFQNLKFKEDEENPVFSPERIQHTFSTLGTQKSFFEALAHIKGLKRLHLHRGCVFTHCASPVATAALQDLQGLKIIVPAVLKAQCAKCCPKLKFMADK